MNLPGGPALDRRAFEKLRAIAPAAVALRRSLREAAAEGSPASELGHRPMPDEVSFKLTNRCDLRCRHCYQWGEDGYHHDLDAAERGGDLDLGIIAGVLEATRAGRANVYLWGGEPLLYRQWDALVDLLLAEERWTSICTNATLVERRFPSLLRLSERLELVVALDGFEADHDHLRGAGSHARTLSALRRLVDAKAAGAYRGEITVNCVLADSLIGRVAELVASLDRLGVDTVYLSFPWFVSAATATAMDAHVAAHLPWLALRNVGTRPSWHAYTFHLSAELADRLRADMAEVAQLVGRSPKRLKVRYNPELGDDDLDAFLAGSDRPAGGRTRCGALASRLDVFPNGDVVTCKFFPETTVGNLNRSSLAEVWNGRGYERMRAAVATCGLMPVCAKCNLLYTRGA